MTKLFRPLLALIASATDAQLRRQARYLIGENNVSRLGTTNLAIPEKFSCPLVPVVRMHFYTATAITDKGTDTTPFQGTEFPIDFRIDALGEGRGYIGPIHGRRKLLLIVALAHARVPLASSC